MKWHYLELKDLGVSPGAAIPWLRDYIVTTVSPGFLSYEMGAIWQPTCLLLKRDHLHESPL